jgi:hypothetical protein
VSHSNRVDVGRRLFAVVRRDHAPAALRRRVLAMGQAERARLDSALRERPPPFENAERPERSAARVARATRGWVWCGALAACVGGVIAVWALAMPPAVVQISAERSGGSELPTSSTSLPSLAPTPPIAHSPLPVPVIREMAPAAVSTPGAPPDVRRSPPRGSPPRSETPAPLPSLDGASTAPPAKPATPPATLSEQLDQIKRVRSLLRSGDPKRALELLDQYPGGSPGSALAAEATLLRIEALAAAGRATEATALARQFATTYPNSPLIDRARSYAGTALEGEPAQKP